MYIEISRIRINYLLSYQLTELQYFFRTIEEENQYLNRV